MTADACVFELLHDAATTDRSASPPEHPINVLSTDSTGKLHVYTRDGSVRSQDVRPWLLQGPWAQDSGTRTAASGTPWPVRLVVPQPSIDVAPQFFAVDPSGSFAVLVGQVGSLTQHTDVRLIDLSSARPLRGAPGAPAGPGSGVDDDTATSGQGGLQRREACDSVVVDAELYEERQGLSVLQVSWHPHSSLHFAILTSDNTWRLYCVTDVTTAEQTFELSLGARRFGLTQGGPGRFSAFTFGNGPSWEKLAVYFCTDQGAIYVLCPVAPFGMLLPANDVRNMASDKGNSSSVTASWIQRALPNAQALLETTNMQRPGNGDDSDSEEGPQGAVGALQRGQKVQSHYLDDHCPALQGPLQVGAPGESDAGGMMAECEIDDMAVALSVLRYGTGAYALCMVTLAGCVGIHLVTSGALPKWDAQAPQTLTQGSRTCVRSQPRPPTNSSGRPALLLDHDGDSRNDARSAADLLLLDLIDLGWTDNLDDVLHRAGARLEGAPGGTLRISVDRANMDRLYINSQCSVCTVRIPWLPVLSGALRSMATSRSAPALVPDLPSATCAQLLSCEPQQGPYEGFAVVGDASTGCAVVALPAVGMPEKVVQVARPPKTGTGPPGPAGALEGAPDNKAAMDGLIDRVYGDLLRDPSKDLQLPAGLPEGPVDPATAQRHLAAAVDLLRRHYVEQVHHANMDLRSRLGIILQDQEKHRATEDQLSAAQHEAAQRMQQVQQRLQRAADMQVNLADRLKLLAELHLLAPQPMTTAERQLKDVQLPALEEQAGALQAQVSDSMRRAQKVLEREQAAANTPARQGVAVGSPDSQTRSSTPWRTPYRSPTATYRAASATNTFRAPSQTPALAASTPFIGVPPAQLRKMREVLSQAADSTKELHGQLERMELAVTGS